MIKLVAFDWNGTILADTQAILDATNYSRRFFGYKPISLKRYQQTFTIPIMEFLKANGWKGKHTAKEHKVFHDYYQKRSVSVRSRRGAFILLRWLQEKNIKSVIYSNHITPEILDTLKRLNLKELFDTVLARDHSEDMEHIHGRTKGGKLEACVRQLKIKPTQVLTVGDTCEEIEIGHDLGFYTVAITGGNNDLPKLKGSKPDFIINNLLELKQIIQTINKK